MVACFDKIGDSEKVIEHGNKLQELLEWKIVSHQSLLNADLPKTKKRINAIQLKKYKQMKLGLEEILANYKLN